MSLGWSAFALLLFGALGCFAIVWRFRLLERRLDLIERSLGLFAASDEGGGGVEDPRLGRERVLTRLLEVNDALLGEMKVSETQRTPSKGKES